MNVFIAIVLIFFLGFVIYIIFPSFVKIILLKQFNQKFKKQPYAYLTFDDGPNSSSTPSILDLLKKNDVKGTFFLAGENIEKYPHIVRRMIDEGHRIGDHGYGHLHPWKCDPVTYIRDLIRGNRLIEKYSENQVSNLFRPPYGKFNLLTLFYILYYKKRVILWNIDPRDYCANSSGEISDYILSKISPGSVILLHDDRRNKNGSDFNITIESVDRVISAGLKSKNNVSFKEII